MKIRIFALLLCLVPCCVASAAVRDESARVGVGRVSMAAARNIGVKSFNIASGISDDKKTTSGTPAESTDASGDDTGSGANTGNSEPVTATNGNCREAYRSCMDEFCLLDESEGGRCACSSNINKSKSLIKEIQSIQAEADKLYTEGVEREQLGAKVSLVFGESESAKRSSRASGISFTEWLNGDDSGDDELGTDDDIGDGLYAMAAEYCAGELSACGSKAEMEEMLYSRQIVADCKAFDSYLAEQKTNANANKRTAEAAVRKARLEMLDTTNKYNRGECLLAYKSCIADKGGCGSNFENCLDADLLGRRANACENVLNQCMAVRGAVLSDWEAEAQSILVDASKYADKYARQTCLARIQDCLETGCSTETNSACLTDVNVAAGVCPVIDECEEMIPGIKRTVNDKLGYLRTQFCQNDVDKCLRNKCGENFSAPECLGKKSSDIVALCPQTMFPSCKNEPHFEIIVKAILAQMDVQQLANCTNYFSDRLGRVCGTDMACLENIEMPSLAGLPSEEEDPLKFTDMRNQLKQKAMVNARVAVDEFFKQFEKDITASACSSGFVDKSTGRHVNNSLGKSIFNDAKQIAYVGAQNRAVRQLEQQIAEYNRNVKRMTGKQNCLSTYRVEKDSADKNKATSYIKSVSYEPDLNNCHVCRMQRVCETGGESKGTAALKAAAGGLSGGAAAGTMVSPGWGTAIGGVIGAVGAGLLGMESGGKEEFCQEIESCEDVNM